MRTTAVCNLKGGVGKTVTAINLAAILARDHNKRVLLVDADSQHNTTDFFGGDPADRGVASYLSGEQDPYYPNNFVETETPGLYLLTGSDDLMDYDISAIRDGRANKQALAELFSVMAEDEGDEDGFDQVVIDCPPAFNAASAAALAAVDEVIIPLALDAFSVSGVANMLRQIHNMRAINPRLRVAGVLITKWRPDMAAQEADLRNLGRVLPVYAHVIRDSRKVTSMTFSGDPLIIHSPHSAAAIDYRRWVREYLGEEAGKDGKAV